MAPRLSEGTIERVRERARIIDLFPEGSLKRVGAEFVTRCCWHDDHRPSLTVSPKTNRAYCFVCARGVDAIGWLEDREGLSFTESVLRLAERYNVVVEAADEADAEQLEAERRERGRLLGLRQQQVAQYAAAIWDSPALQYLAGRGITPLTIEDWQLGYARVRERCGDDEWVTVERMMVPLRDPQGRVIAFAGRRLGDEPVGKWRNSPNDALFDKARLVFGLDRARASITRGGHAVIVEGQLDVIACHQHGLTNVVAIGGSSLTASQIEGLVRLTRARRITLAFDGDEGGRKAADRAIRALHEPVLRNEVDLRIVVLPEGRDPGDSAAEMAALVEAAPHWAEYWWNREVGKIDLADASQAQAAEAGVRRILRALPEGPLRAWVRRRAQEFFGEAPSVPAAVVRTQGEIDRCRWAERRALRLYLAEPGCRPALDSIGGLTDPLLQRGWEWAHLLAARDPTGELTLPAFKQLLLHADEEFVDALRPLAQPIPEVRRVLEANPMGELEAALEGLRESCCPAEEPGDTTPSPVV